MTAQPPATRAANAGSLKNAARIPELDGIRGIAIAMVLVHHYFYLAVQAKPATLLSYALVSGRLLWSGVDLFFVLSGFLIGGILLDARESTNYFKVFYTRRFFRIVPIYLVCLLCVLLLIGLVHSIQATKVASTSSNQIPWFPYFVFLQNFWMSYKNTLGLTILAVTWSLAVEEQFYLTLPALVRIFRPARLIAAVVAGIFLAPLLRTAFYLAWPDHIYSWVVLMPCRADALLLGVFAAFAMRNDRWRETLLKSRNGLRAIIGMLAVGLVFFILKSASPYSRPMLTFGFTWIAALYACVLVYAVSFHESWIASCLRWGWLRWLGAIAYGVYLFHEFIRAALFGLIWSRPPVITSLSELVVSIAALALTLTVCRFSWLYFEKPLVAVGHRVHYEQKQPQTSAEVTQEFVLNASIGADQGGC